MVLNSWTADDLGAKVGDRLQLRFSVLGPHGSLSENAATFTITGVVPIAGLAADRELMPAFPGIAEAANCKEWKPGMAIDLARIRDKDEDYWKAHRGTPKAFVSLAAGQRLWSNRFGTLTALRLDASRHPVAEVERTLVASIDPRQVGLAYVPVRDRALAASAGALDIGSLFLSLGFFLIVAALLLAGLLMSLALSTRRRDLGLLLALGFTPRQVRRLILGEVVLAAIVGSTCGCGIGVGYAWGVLGALAGRWSAAVGGGAFSLSASTETMAIGMLATVATAVLTLWWSLRRCVSQSVRELLADAPRDAPAGARSVRSLVIALVMIAIALAVYGAKPSTGEAASESVVLIGACLLIALIAGLSAAATRTFAVHSLAGLAVANATRHRGRSLAVVSMLAAAIFLIVAVGAFRPAGTSGLSSRQSGTGGFALIADATVPIAGDLNDPQTRRRSGLDVAALESVRLVGMRTDDGDDASCLNLNHSPQPRLFAVDPAALAGRFAVAQAPPGGGDPWTALSVTASDGVVPAIADQATAEWSLGKGVGDTVIYRDERGAPVTVRIMATLDHSLLQGGLIISEQAFVRAFPSRGGCSQFLIDAPAARAPAVARALAQAFSDHGLRVQPASERLASYLAVEGTYLDIFQALGWFALLLGSAGVGVVLVQSAIERRGELGMLRAIGFTRAALARVLLGEHAVLFVCALLGGGACGLIAVAPQLHAGGGLPWWSLAGLSLALVVSGVLWMAVGTWWALRGALITAVRSE
jgi:ABC-type antimicrobial peptide transport system permease subunit